MQQLSKFITAMTTMFTPIFFGCGIFLGYRSDAAACCDRLYCSNLAYPRAVCNMYPIPILMCLSLAGKWLEYLFHCIHSHPCSLQNTRPSGNIQVINTSRASTSDHHNRLYRKCHFVFRDSVDHPYLHLLRDRSNRHGHSTTAPTALELVDISSRYVEETEASPPHLMM